VTLRENTASTGRTRTQPKTNLSVGASERGNQGTVRRKQKKGGTVNLEMKTAQKKKKASKKKKKKQGRKKKKAGFPNTRRTGK